jgi:hypothetical protein
MKAMKWCRLALALVLVGGLLILCVTEPAYADPNCNTNQCVEVRYEAKAKDDVRNKYCWVRSSDQKTSPPFAFSVVYATYGYGQNSKGGKLDPKSGVLGYYLKCQGTSDCKVARYPVSGTVDSYSGEPINDSFKTKCTGTKTD